MSVHLMNWLKSPLPLKSLYFVIGQESFFISEIKKTFIKNIHSDSVPAEFNHDEVHAGEIAIEDILTLLETLPFMTEKRLVFCYKAEKFQNEDWENLKPFFSQTVESVVFVCFFEKKDARKKHFKIFKEKAVQLVAEPLRPWELGPWLDLLSKKEGLEFSSNSKSLFNNLLGTNLMEIQLELKKLKQYMGESKQILEKDVMACTSRLKTDSVFELTEAIGTRDIPRALSALAYLLEQNQNELGALAMVARHIRSLSNLQQGERQKLSKAQLAHKAGISPYFLKNYLNQAQLWSEEQIHQTMEALYETDKALKSSPLSSHIWLENFILKVCS